MTEPANPRKPPTAKEAELVDAFLVCVRAAGFKVFPECNDFDVLLVATDDCLGFKAGDQIGVEAKMVPNEKVLHQALPRLNGAGPHYYVVLVPQCSYMFREIATRIGITVVTREMIEATRVGRNIFNRILARRHEPKQLCWVPDCEVPERRGGLFGPKKITKWQMSAVKLCMFGVTRGYLMREDFTEAGIDIQLFIKRGWILPFDKVKGSKGRMAQRYVMADNPEAPHLKYIDIAEALEKAGVL